MEVSVLIGHIMTVLPFLERIFSIYGNPNGIAMILLMGFAVIVAVTLIVLLRKEQNKKNTLQIMSKDNRSLGVRLLLVYQRLVRSKEERFKASRLIITNAVYSYNILKGTDPSDPLKDIQCEYKFTIKRTARKSVHILFAQDQGLKAGVINYRFENDKNDPGRNTKLKAFSIKPSEKSAGFSGLYYAEIMLPDEERKRSTFDLVVTFTLARAYNIKKGCDAFVICPFLYAKKMHSFEISANFSTLPIPLRPDIVDLHCYPYDGAKYMPERIVDFKVPKDHKIWKEEIQHCHTKAAYYLEIRQPTTQSEQK